MDGHCTIYFFHFFFYLILFLSNFPISANYFEKNNKIVENSVTYWNNMTNEMKSIKSGDNFKSKITETILSTL